MVQSSKRIIDEYLVAYARLGDWAAQEQLVRRYQKRFLRHAYRLLGDAEQARDAVQDGWLDILRGLPRLKDEGVFAAWAFRIITCKCAKQIAGLQKTRKTLKTVSAEQSRDAQGSDDIERAADSKPVHEALAKLPVEQRTAVALFYLEDMSVAEVAVALDIPVGTVKSRLMNARKKLREALEGEKYGCPR
ncbi:MAG: RNA polymerase sigma factor [Hyphomicrobiaceae bacterium]